MRISKVYTRTGDTGETSLVGGERVSKSSPRVEAFGEVDELNSIIGFARSYISDEEVGSVLRQAQNDLFTVGGDLASPSGVEVPRIDESHIKALESDSDKFLASLEPLREFILPGGSQAGAALHIARTVARRAERRVVSLAETEEINEMVKVYLNRLSDLLFILSRVVNMREGVAENQADFSRRSRS